MRLIGRITSLATATALGLFPIASTAAVEASEPLATMSELHARSYGSPPVEVDTVVYGDEVDLYGQVLASDGSYAQHGDAILQLRTPTNSTWTTVAPADWPGTFAFHYFRPTSNAEYRILYNGYTAASSTEVSYAPSQSAPISIDVSRAITVKPSRSGLVGTVSPDYTHRKVKVLRKVDGKFTPYTSVKTNSASKFRVRLSTPEKSSDLRLKFVIPRGPDFVRTIKKYSRHPRG